MVLVNKEAPYFSQKAVMVDSSIKDISLHDYKGKMVVLFFYPLNFTFVCPTEIIAFDKRIDEFIKRNVVVLGVSVDSIYSHIAWRETAINKGGIGKIRYPLISDITRKITKDYGILTPEGVALRGSFLIDRNGIVKHQVVNDLALGRNIDEMIRMVDALKHFEEYGEVCPAGWDESKKAFKPSQEGVSNFLEKEEKSL